MPSSGARRRLRPNRRDRERTRNFNQRIENNKELVKSTGDTYDDTMKLTISLVNRLSLSSNFGRSSSKISDRKKANFERRRRRVTEKKRKSIKAIEPATIDFTLPALPSCHKNGSNADGKADLTEQPERTTDNLIKCTGESNSMSKNPTEEKLNTSRNVKEKNCLKRLARLMKMARGSKVCEFCKNEGCALCKLVADS